MRSSWSPAASRREARRARSSHRSTASDLREPRFGANVRIADNPLRTPATSLCAARADKKQEGPPALPEPVDLPPEHMPRLTRTPADEDICVSSDGAVLDTEGNGDVASSLARLENGFEVAAEKTRRNDGLGRGIAVTPQPMGVRAADYFRQASTAAVKVDGGGLTRIAGQNANRLAVARERIANADHSAGHFGPAELLVEIAVCRVGDSPPA